MFRLLIMRPDGREVDQEFDGPQIMIGRHEKCDLCLVDTMVSRNHCMILKEGKRHVVKDLDSRNGTWINGRKIRNRSNLKENDVIQVGPFRLVYSTEPGAPERLHTHTVEMDSLLDMEPIFIHRNEAEKVVKPLGMISNYLSETTSGDVQRTPTKVRRERLNRNLITLYRITEELVATKDLGETLDYIMDQIFSIFSPSQATILLNDRDGVPVPHKMRSKESGGLIRPISNTIINRILNDRVSVLTDNALEDPRFEMGESVIVDGIRSVMAAPIWEERNILGVIYVDSLDLIAGYQSEDLDLLTAIGHQAAIAIQRWKLTEQLREEAVKNAVIRQNLGRFHSPQVVDLIIKGAADLAVKETEASIFFCDIAGFTTLCESASPQQVQRILNLFFKTVNEAIFREQGTLDKFIGDGAMAIFGAPLPQVDHPVRAIRAALQIREQLSYAVKRLPEELRFRVRYGINTGLAVVGNFGSDERVDYTVLGHAVNVASRISRTAEPDQILIGGETYEQTVDKNLFEIEKIGTRSLRGLKGKKRIFEVLGYMKSLY